MCENKHSKKSNSKCNREQVLEMLLHLQIQFAVSLVRDNNEFRQV